MSVAIAATWVADLTWLPILRRSGWQQVVGWVHTSIQLFLFNIGFFNIGRIVGLQEFCTCLQEGEIIVLGSQDANIDQFKRGFPCALFRSGSRLSASLDDQRSKAAAALPMLFSRSDVVRATDQQQAWLRHINLRICGRPDGD